LAAETGTLGDMSEKKRKMRVPKDPIAAAAGFLKGRIPPSEVLRARAREDERRAIARREEQPDGSTR